MKMDKENSDEPGRQVVQQEQVQAPITYPRWHNVKPLFFYQKPEEFGPQQQLPIIA